MMAGPCRQTKDGPECSGPSLARRPVESRAELLRLSEVDGDGLAVVRPLSLVNLIAMRISRPNLPPYPIGYERGVVAYFIAGLTRA